jgi:methylamine dehydrogenase accessory protein MauD
LSVAWQVLVIALWVVVVAQAGLILALYRQFGLIYLAQGDARSRDGLPLRSKAPPWEAEDQMGVVRNFAEFHNRPTVLVFADPGCRPCKKLMPELRDFVLQHRDRLDVVIIGSDDAEDNREMAEHYALDLPVIRQHDGELAALYNVTATPFVFVIDAEGAIREKGVVNLRDQLDEKITVLEKEHREEVLT